VVDKASKDKTLEIVQKSGADFEVKEWAGYSETKKYALSKVNSDWVFWIDSDEVLTAALQEEIRAFKNIPPSFPVYKVNRRAYFLGKWIRHGGWYPGRVARLFDRTKVTFNNNDVHEGLEFTGEAGILKNDLEHYTDLDIKHYYQKFNNYTSLAANELLKKGKSFRLNDLILRPLFFFIKMYIIRLGFLDGVQGFILAVFSTNYVFTKYAKLWELNKKR
jgi:glycosyltransferase involved in cell wall biosynthesis